MNLRKAIVLLAVLAGFLLLMAPGAMWAQINTVNLTGVVSDPQGLAMSGAKVTVKSNATGLERTAVTNGAGRYEVIGLAPGEYSVTIEAEGFAKLESTGLVLTLGVAAEYSPQLSLKSATTIVSVNAEAALVETSKSDVSQTITPTQIDNLPINRRDYINFALLTPQSARDDTPSIGAAPTSGLNFGGQRGRSNEISVDGADAVDNSVNGVRATVSQEAVQEFQVITSNYMPEYGRAMGGVVNIVTKSGSNEVHGNIFGFLRLAALQARDPFSVQGTFNPATESVDLTPIKQSFTRVQAGATLGGPIQKNKTFYFFSYETIRAEATGFTNIGTDNFGLTPATLPCLGNVLMTPTQGPFYGAALTGAVCSPANPIVQAAGLTAQASATALLGNLPGGPTTFFDGAPLPGSYAGLVSLLGNYPTKEGTSFWSLKLDHIWNSKNASFIRASVSPSLITGIQVNAENQNFGQNSGNRTSEQQTRDLAIVAQHTTSFHDNMFNELRFQYARRGLHYGFSDLPGGDSPAVNIDGFAFFGREPFSTEDRIERRFQWADDLTWTKGTHTMKFGGDFNLLQLRTGAQQIFELNYGGVYTFSSLDPSALGLPEQAGPFNAVQAFGLGIPQEYIQGIGNSNHPFDNKALGLFWQDSWKINRKLTLNYGLRYDIEWNPVFPAANPLNAAGEKAFGVIQGIPLNKHNFAPRVAVAWDPWGNGKTVIRAGYGLFYDHPPLALAFLANAFDGAASTLLESAGGSPCVLTALGCSVDNPLNFGALNATNVFQGLLTGTLASCSTAVPSMCFQPNEQRFNPTFTNSLFTNQNYLTANGGLGFPLPFIPFTIPVQKNFKYAYAEQGNLTIERELGHNWKMSVGYNYTHGVHLDHTRNINTANPELLAANDNNAVLSGLVAPLTNPITIAVPSPATPGCAMTPGGGSVFVSVPGILGTAYPIGDTSCSTTPLGAIGTPAVFNFFRPSGPNPSFAGLVGGYTNLVGLAASAGFPQGFPGVQIPWSDVEPQVSAGNSVYNSLTVSVTKRFSQHFELLSGWTYSHAIDDSTDLSTLLDPQDNNFPELDRGNSDFDQRHRWITSGVYLSPHGGSGDSALKKFLGDFTVAPIIELASGRPYNILTGFDPNLDFGTATNRPDALPAGAPVPAGFPVVTSPFVKGVEFTLPTRCIDPSGKAFSFPAVPSPFYGCTGTLARNAFNRPGYFDIDLRLARKIQFNERWNLEIIADGFNLLNRFNAADVNPLCDTTAGSPTCSAGQPTAALDPRTFQFALKVNW